MKSDWVDLLKEEMQKEYFIELNAFLDKEYKTNNVIPKQEDILKALQITPYEIVKCVILGQDPYPDPKDACGLAFSSNNGIPKSLANIYIELNNDLGVPKPTHGNLSKWAKQGVLLLNSVLTTEANISNAHRNIGWEIFTNKILSIVSMKTEPTVFLLWGRAARNKKNLISNKESNLVLEAAHPSPYSAYNGFFGSKPFSKTNEFLRAHNCKEIDWSIEN